MFSYVNILQKFCQIEDTGHRVDASCDEGTSRSCCTSSTREQSMGGIGVFWCFKIGQKEKDAYRVGFEKQKELMFEM